MQAAKKAVESVKETAANIGASAKSGMEKTKATLQEKGELMNANDQKEKDMATEKKQDKINQAEMEKLRAREFNAAAKQSALAQHAHGPGNETATYDPVPITEISTNSLNGPGSDNATYTGPGTETSPFDRFGPGSDAIPPTTGHGHGHGLGPESSTCPTAELGQMGSNQMAAMPGPDQGYVLGHGPEPGPGHGGLPPVETNTGVDTTTQTGIGGGSAPASGPI